jgi:hypothetical protein
MRIPLPLTLSPPGLVTELVDDPVEEHRDTDQLEV